MDYFAAMPTCAARNAVRDDTLADFARFDIDVKLFACEDADKTPRQRFLTNLFSIERAFRQSKAPYLLYLEDDVHVADHFGTMLRRAILGEFDLVSFFNPTRNGYQSEVLKAIDAQQPVPVSLYPVAGQSSWYSALALLISRRAVQQLWQVIDYDADRTLDQAIQSSKFKLHCAVPNPIDHRDVPSATSGHHWAGRIRSISYPEPE